MSSKSYRHSDEKRAHIPSKEEAGYEDANPKVQSEGERYALPVNPILHRGRDPELFWMDKYKHNEKIRTLLDQLAEASTSPDVGELVNELRTALSDPPEEAWNEMLDIDIRSLYRTEHIAPEMLIEGLTKLVENHDDQGDLFATNELFGNSLEKDELSKVSDYYTHSDGWTNRLILGDSERVMTSLLEREGMAGQVQTIYIDPPYGIQYDSNWQMKINDRRVTDGKDEHLTEEPEQIKAYRDTWEKGIHSYLSYLKNRLLIAKELLKESGSCFVQISDENLHLVRNLMDEVFGSENFVSLISFTTTSGFPSKTLSRAGDYIVWYSKSLEKIKYRSLFKEKVPGEEGATKYKPINSYQAVPQKHFSKNEYASIDPITSQGETSSDQRFEFNGQVFEPPQGMHWKTTVKGLKRLDKLNRLVLRGNSIRYIRLLSDYPVYPMTNLWTDVAGVQNRTQGKIFVVQTSTEIVKRCMLMTTDPGDLVLDPTCGSGTTAHVAEKWGRRWITIDTSRIALNIAKNRLMTATFPYFFLQSEVDVYRAQTEMGGIKKEVKYKSDAQRKHNIKEGFVYKEVPHKTLGQLAKNEEPETEILFDQPFKDENRMRVSGPFTVETLQNLDPVHPEEIEQEAREDDEAQKFEEMVFQHLTSAGIKNGIKQEKAVFTQVDRLINRSLHAEGYYKAEEKERKAYFHIGPKFGTVSKKAVNEAIKECRAKGDADWLVVLGFSFESDIENESVTQSMGSFEVTKVRMADDLLQDGLLKKDKKAASFVTIGEPDIELSPFEGGQGDVDESENLYQLEVKGIDIYDPVKNQIKPRNARDIAYWSVDDNYDGSNFVVRQIFFSGGDNDEFDDIKKDLEQQAKYATKKKLEHTLRIEIDDKAFDRLYGLKSHPFEAEEGQKVAVRVVSQFGEEVTKVLTVN
ncbi:MAG TPA: site-specific DNA-methyltransferase [Balneolaceae bacterium]|nr:site-specific DNA-methyltransferase [Balneolaceae bacterium]